MRIVKTIYACDVCGRESEDKDEVAKCEATPIARISGFTAGDVLVGVGRPIGKFALEGANSDPAWFLEERGDQSSRDHFERDKGGWVKWVVLDKVVVHEVDDQRRAIRPGRGHREALLLYAPSHPCYANKGPAYGYFVPNQNTRVVAVVNQQDLDGYRSVGMRGKPGAIDY